MASTDIKDPVGRITDLLTEASLGRWQFINQAFMNDTMYLGHIPESDIPLPGLSYILINKTGQAIISHAQIQVETRPRITISPRQTTSLPTYWMTRRGLATIRAGIDQAIIPAFEEEEADPADLLVGEPDVVESEGFSFSQLDNGNADAFEVGESFYARASIFQQPWLAADGVTVMQPLLKMSDMVIVDDALTAKCVQNNIDIAWEADDRDLWLRNNIVNCLKFGTQGVMFCFDREKRMSKVFDIHVLNLFLPPNCTGIKDAEYVIVREITSARDAKERFPYAAKEIDENQQRNTTSDSAASATLGDAAPYAGMTFGRDMVQIWHVWLRNERYPMSPDEALENGRVVQKKNAFYLTDEDYNITDEATAPGEKNWPDKLGIKYQQMIGMKIVYDEECAHVDIPVVLNQNIPVSYSPWHQGEPERLWYCQKLIDKLSSIILDHLTYFRSPQQILPASVYKRLKGLNSIHSHPARDAWIDDTTFQLYQDFFLKKGGFFIDPPTVSPQYVEIWQLALQLFDELSGHAGVLQGRAPGANSSGKVVEDLQNAARATVGFKAASTEAMLRQLAKLEIDAWAKWMPLFAWAKANDSYPPSILAAVRERSREMEYNVVIEVASGGGQLRKQQQAQAFEEVGVGLRSPESYRRLAGSDEEDVEWVNPATAAAAPAQPVSPQATQQAQIPPQQPPVQQQAA